MNKATFKDIDAFANWYLSKDGGAAWLINYESFINSIKLENFLLDDEKRFRDLFETQRDDIVRRFYREDKSDAELYTEWRDKQGKKSMTALKNIASNLERFNQQFELTLTSNNIAVIGTPGKGFQFILPDYEKWLDASTATDYSDIPLNQIKAIAAPIGNGTLIVTNEEHGSLTIKSLKNKENEIKDEIARVAKFETDELATLKKQLEAEENALRQRKINMMATMEAMKDKLEDGMRGLQKQIFFLETEIYGIQCYLGETISFVKLRNGASAPAAQPVLLMQKVRFLDEDLGRMASLYGIDGDDCQLFEDFLTHRSDAMEYFCPSNKSVSLVRISKNNKYFGMHEKFENMLSEYKLYHGTQIGILIRDGENLYAGWTETDHVNIPDDFFLTPGEKIITADEVEPTKSKYGIKKEPSKKEVFDEQMRGAQEVASRFFLFNLLQGAIDAEKPLLIFDEKITLNVPSPKVIFSTADNWLDDNRFGRFYDIMSRCNEATKQGDVILSMQRLCPSSYNRFGESNSRGRGYADRTHDCSIKDNEIYKINLVEATKYRYFCWKQSDGVLYKEQTPAGYVTLDYSYRTQASDRDVLPNVGDTNGNNGMRCQDTFVKELIEYTYKHYVSVEKSYSGSGARANFCIKDGEFMNLTYMNSDWLKYVISTKKIDGWSVGGKSVDFAYLIQYLNKALEYVKAREITEENLISKQFDEKSLPENWRVELSEWKLAKTVRKINEFQAKRFSNWLKAKI